MEELGDECSFVFVPCGFLGCCLTHGSETWYCELIWTYLVGHLWVWNAAPKLSRSALGPTSFCVQKLRQRSCNSAASGRVAILFLIFSCLSSWHSPLKSVLNPCAMSTRRLSWRSDFSTQSLKSMLCWLSSAWFSSLICVLDVSWTAQAATWRCGSAYADPMDLSSGKIT